MQDDVENLEPQIEFRTPFSNSATQPYYDGWQHSHRKSFYTSISVRLLRTVIK
jgi:hypothetical protein